MLLISLSLASSSIRDQPSLLFIRSKIIVHYEKNDVFFVVDDYFGTDGILTKILDTEIGPETVAE